MSKPSFATDQPHFGSPDLHLSIPPPAVLHNSINVSRHSPRSSYDSTTPKKLKNSSTFSGGRNEDFTLPPMDHGWRAWRFVTLAFLLEFIIWGPSVAFGTFQQFYTSPTRSPFTNTSGNSASMISIIGTTSLALNYVLLLPGTIFFRAHPQWIKRGMGISIAGFGISVLLASFGEEVWHFIVFQGVLPGIFAGILNAPIFILLSEWFTSRGLASGIIFSGCGAAGFLLPPIVNLLLNSVGAANCLRIFGAVILFVGGIVVWALERRVEASGQVDSEKDEQVGGVKPSGSRWRFLVDPSLFFVILSTALSTLASSSLSVFLPTLATQYTTPLNSNLLLSLMNIFAIAGQVISGALQDSPAPSSKSWKLLRTKGSPYYFIVGVSSLMSSVGVLGGLAFVHNVKELVGVVIWLGLAAGAFAATWIPTSIALSKGDAGESAKLFGLLGIIKAIFSIIGPLISGNLLNPSPQPSSTAASTHSVESTARSYSTFIWTTGISFLLAAVGGAVIGAIEMVRRRRLESAARETMNVEAV